MKQGDGHSSFVRSFPGLSFFRERWHGGGRGGASNRPGKLVAFDLEPLQFMARPSFLIPFDSSKGGWKVKLSGGK